MAISDIFCLPSYREGFGTTVIEAAAMGLPTVGTKIKGLVDAIEDGKTGILVSCFDVQELFLGIKCFLDDPLLMEKMGAAARQRCKQHFDKNIINLMLAREYAHILANTRIN